MGTIPSPEVRHLKPLDGLRGLAILMVMLSHAFESNAAAASLPFRLLAEIFYFGKFGVDLFFVLSGFLITGILVDTRHDEKYFGRFFARRALRILPLYYGVLVVLLVLTAPLHLQWNGMALPLLAYLQNYWPARIDHLALAPHIALYHFWSLAIEEQFYLVWPFVVYGLRARKDWIFRAAVVGSVVALGLRLALLTHGVPGLVIHLATPTRMDSLLIGGMLALAYRSTVGWERVQRLAPWICVGLALPVIAGVLIMHGDDSGNLWTYGFRYTVLAVACAGLIAWSLRSGSRVQRGFEQRWLRFLGKYSYGLYVLHIFVFSLIPVFRGKIYSLTGSRAVSVGGAGLICMALSIVAAYLSFHLYENQFLKLKRLFTYRTVEPARNATVA